MRKTHDSREQHIKVRVADTLNGQRIIINPPPDDKRCECCGRHFSELKPYGKAGDPLNGNFEGAMLVKNFRESTSGTVGASWECRDCHIMDTNKYQEFINKKDISKTNL